MTDTIPVFLAEDQGLIQLLVFDEKSNRMNTQYGRITHLSWLKKEKARIEQAPNRVAAIVERVHANKKDGAVTQYALYVNRAPDYIHK